MGPTVLGKRSRQAVEHDNVALPLPARKRKTRTATPRIFEDATDCAVESQLDTKDSTPRKSRPSRTRIVSTKPSRNRKVITKNDVRCDLEGDDFQDENIPPVVTPCHNRFKDALSSQPSTPKHRVRLAGGLLTPRQTPSTTSSPRQRPQSVFATARQLFSQSSNPTKLVGRDGERKELQEFFSTAVSLREGACAYVSGPPGTGKSALVHEVLQEYQCDSRLCISIINCTTLKTSSEVYSKLLADFAPDANATKASAKAQLTKMFTNRVKSTMYAVMVDEIDSLLDADCEVLYSLFEWSLHASSSLALVGIANALDLTDRFLPRLKSRGLKPQLIPFLPYTAPQISAIISDKLKSLLVRNSTAPTDFVPFMHPAAIQLCGKKVASQTGDLRRAFNLVRRSIDQVEKETLSKGDVLSPSKKPLGEIANESRDLASLGVDAACLTPETAPRATIAHVARLASSIFNTGTLFRLGGLNLQQKAVLCSLISRESRHLARSPFGTPSKTLTKSPTVKDLFAKYSMLCKRDDGLLQPLKDTEFRDVIASLMTLGLLHEGKSRLSSLTSAAHSLSRAGRTSDETQIASAVSEKEMRDSLAGAGTDLLLRLLDE